MGDQREPLSPLYWRDRCQEAESELARVREERDQLREEIAYLARFVERKHHPDGSSTTRVAPDGYTAAMLAVGIADAVDFARAVLGPEPEASKPKPETPSGEA